MYKKIRAIALNSKAEGKTADYLSNVLKRDEKTLEKVIHKTGLSKENILKEVEVHISKELKRVKEISKEPVREEKPKQAPINSEEIKKDGDE